jgi:hypothetical protein
VILSFDSNLHREWSANLRTKAISANFTWQTISTSFIAFQHITLMSQIVQAYRGDLRTSMNYLLCNSHTVSSSLFPDVFCASYQYFTKSLSHLPESSHEVVSDSRKSEVRVSLFSILIRPNRENTHIKNNLYPLAGFHPTEARQQFVQHGSENFFERPLFESNI